MNWSVSAVCLPTASRSKCRRKLSLALSPVLVEGLSRVLLSQVLAEMHNVSVVRADDHNSAESIANPEPRVRSEPVGGIHYHD